MGLLIKNLILFQISKEGKFAVESYKNFFCQMCRFRLSLKVSWNKSVTFEGWNFKKIDQGRVFFPEKIVFFQSLQSLFLKNGKLLYIPVVAERLV